MGDLDSRRTAYTAWLTSEISAGVDYHNHKETMAWTATAGTLAVAGAIIASPPPVLGANRWASLIILAAAAIAVLSFVHMQFERRWKAADNLVGLRREISRVCSTAAPEGNLCLPGIPSGNVDEFCVPRSALQ